jgi:cell division protein ZapA (FtsZ GTPase activity inhibitor)
MENLIPISLLIGDRTYRIRVQQSEEEYIRKMAKKLNDQIAGFKNQYGGKDMQDYLAMVLLSIVTEKEDREIHAELPDIIPSLEKLEGMLDKALEEQDR